LNARAAVGRPVRDRAAHPIPPADATKSVRRRAAFGHFKPIGAAAQPSPGRLLLTINHNDAARFGEGPPRRTIVAAAARGRWSGSTALFILIEEFATPIGAYQQPSINLKNSPENVKGLAGAT
jgi:hypothetical protein